MQKYRGNLDDSLILKHELEVTSYFWVKFERHSYDAKSFITSTNTRMTPYSPDDFKQFMKTITNQNLDTPGKLRAVLNWDSWKIVHNPELVKDINDLKIK